VQGSIGWVSRARELFVFNVGLGSCTRGGRTYEERVLVERCRLPNGPRRSHWAPVTGLAGLFGVPITVTRATADPQGALLGREPSLGTFQPTASAAVTDGVALRSTIHYPAGSDLLAGDAPRCPGLVHETRL